jgi:cytochrome c-type biogenesis protein CcsB
MEYLVVTVILFYLLSSVGYIAFFLAQKDYLHKAGYYLLLTGCLFHVASIVQDFAISGSMPARNLYETLSVAGCATAGVFLILSYKFRLKILGGFAAPLSSVIMVFAATIQNKPVPVDSALNSFWLPIHVVAIFIGEAAFAMACCIGFFYIIQERAIKKKSHGFFFKRLPSLDLLDSSAYLFLVTGFTMLTIGLIVGVVYAKSVWGRFWSWDIKEVWSAISWLVYAALLHQRIAFGWRGRRTAIMAIIGFAFLLFTFIGVNFLLQSHHGGFTRW